MIDCIRCQEAEAETGRLARLTLERVIAKEAETDAVRQELVHVRVELDQLRREHEALRKRCRELVI